MDGDEGVDVDVEALDGEEFQMGEEGAKEEEYTPRDKVHIKIEGRRDINTNGVQLKKGGIRGTENRSDKMAQLIRRRTQAKGSSAARRHHHMKIMGNNQVPARRKSDIPPSTSPVEVCPSFGSAYIIIC